MFPATVRETLGEAPKNEQSQARVVADYISSLTEQQAIGMHLKLVGVDVGTALRSFLGTRGRSMPASRAAKVKTMLQLVAITMYLLPLTSAFDAAKGGVLIAAVAMTLATGFAYVMRARGELRRAGRPA